MTSVDDFFNVTEADPIREGGMPMLIPRGLESTGIRSAYTRASGLAEYVDASKEHIHRWEMRYLAKGLGRRPDLAALAAVETYSTGVTDAVYGREKSMSGKRLDSIIERALDGVRIHEKADRGTTVHAATEPGGPPPEAVPAELRGAVQAWWDTNRRECIEVVGTETFTANDVTMSAGTFDHLVRVPGHPLLTDYVVADKKTGRYSPFEWSVQISSYARGEVYDTSTDRRIPWPGKINLDWGLVWQIDCEPGTPDDQRVKLHILDLQFGWRMAQIAAEVRDGHARRDIAAPYRPATFQERLVACNTKDDLTRLWYSTTDPAERALVEQKGATL